MSNFNENWSRWCFASFSKFFDSKKGSVYLYVEGMDRDTAAIQDLAEFRMDGPRIKEIGRHLIRLEVSVNVLVKSTMDDKDAHKLQRTAGVMTAAFEDKIMAYKYGDGVDDDGSLFACFIRVSDTGNKIGFDTRINNFGIIDANLRIQQATIEARYFAEIAV